MPDSKLIPVILSGGAGTRLWPVSRQMHPKPFIKLEDGQSLIQKTMLRASALPDVSTVLTITNRDLYFKTRDEYQEAGVRDNIDFDYFLEPCSRNTAPAIIISALKMIEDFGGNPVMLVMPADHIIDDQEKFSNAVEIARQLAVDHKLVTFGIIPDSPETAYGYIHKGQKLDNYDAFSVTEFVEKPEEDVARKYLKSGDYFWNSGIFCFGAKDLVDEATYLDPQLMNDIAAAFSASSLDDQPVMIDEDAYSKISNISIDYAIMEKTTRAAVVPCDFGWNDIGSWDSFCNLTVTDASGNAATGEPITINTSNTYISCDDRLIAAVGVSDLVIVDTADALLVADKKYSQDVKAIVDKLKELDNETYLLHRTVHRPWGTYTVLEEGPGFKIKRIYVKPGERLSLQYHHHRSEHWVVVSGIAKVDDGDKERLVNINESTYIPAGTPHRLSNPTEEGLEIIEIQCGHYLGEDDIVRLEDLYGREM